jgi:hypothetical protein
VRRFRWDRRTSTSGSRADLPGTNHHNGHGRRVTETIAWNRWLMGSGESNRGPKWPRNHSGGRVDRRVMSLAVLLRQWRVLEIRYSWRHRREDAYGDRVERKKWHSYSKRLSAPFAGTALADTARAAHWSRGRQSGNLSKGTDSEEDWMTEVEEQRDDEEIATCHMCGQTFSTQVEPSQHLMNAHDDDALRTPGPAEPQGSESHKP